MEDNYTMKLHIRTKEKIVMVVKCYKSNWKLSICAGAKNNSFKDTEVTKEKWTAGWVGTLSTVIAHIEINQECKCIDA